MILCQHWEKNGDIILANPVDTVRIHDADIANNGVDGVVHLQVASCTV